MFQFGGNLLHPPGIGRAVKDADTGRISVKRGTGEGIDYMQLVTRGNGLVRRFIKDLWQYASLVRRTYEKTWGW